MESIRALLAAAVQVVKPRVSVGDRAKTENPAKNTKVKRNPGKFKARRNTARASRKRNRAS